MCYNDWAQARNAKITTDVIFLDFTKAFDSVPHEHLLYKLEQYGISGVLLNWFRNFLTNRSQRVVVRGSFSTWTKVTSGVPQGTILGPIVFLIYINDFLNGISSPTKLFADDTKVYRGLIDLEKDKQILQSDLDRMTEWTNTWQLHFNSDKCEVMRITHQKDISLPDYNLSGKKLKVVNEFKDLGVIMTSNLSWSNQVASSVKKSNRILGLIKRTVGSFTPTSTFTTLYKSLVRPLLEYAAPVWSPHLVKVYKH